MLIQMVDLKGQYYKIKAEIDEAVISCISSTKFINGPEVNEFQEMLEDLDTNEDLAEYEIEDFFSIEETPFDEEY